MEKRISPYERLRQTGIKFANSVKYPKRIFMWRYPSEKLTEAFVMIKLAERVSAAKQLGYDVLLEVQENGDLNVMYVEKRPEIPFQFRN